MSDDDWAEAALARAEADLEAKDREQLRLAQQVAGLRETVHGLRRMLGRPTRESVGGTTTVRAYGGGPVQPDQMADFEFTLDGDKIVGQVKQRSGQRTGVRLVDPDALGEEQARRVIQAAARDRIIRNETVHAERRLREARAELEHAESRQAELPGTQPAHEGPQTEAVARTVADALAKHAEFEPDTSSTGRAMYLLSTADRPMTMQRARVEFERRGWIDPEWKHPMSAVNMAFQRLRKAGQAEKLPDGRWVSTARHAPPSDPEFPFLTRTALASASGGGPADSQQGGA
jgi:hypothetical protein